MSTIAPITYPAGIRPATDLINLSSQDLGLINEATRSSYRNAFFNGGAFSNSQGGTIPIFRNGVRLTTGKIQIYLHGSAFAGESIIFGTMSLHEVLNHEFMHAGGQPPTPGFGVAWAMTWQASGLIARFWGRAVRCLILKVETGVARCSESG
jgi:hypothetical protein